MSPDATTVRLAASLFSAPVFRPILASGRNPDAANRVARLQREMGLTSGATNGLVIDAAYRLLSRYYRNEYVYKNLIASKIFVGRHRAANSVLLSEFSVGSAVADSILVNGRATAFEIKTELDSPDKLPRQLSEYARCFAWINVVVHESQSERYLKHLRGGSTGLISVNRRLQLSTIKPALEDQASLCVRTMFNSMRVREIEQILFDFGFELPDVPNGRRYDEHLKMALEVPPDVFHRAWMATMKRRNLRGDMTLHRDPRLFSLRALIVQLDPDQAAGSNLLSWLSQRSL